MFAYSNLSGQSGIAAYDYGETYVKVRFKTGGIYLWRRREHRARPSGVYEDSGGARIWPEQIYQFRGAEQLCTARSGGLRTSLPVFQMASSHKLCFIVQQGIGVEESDFKRDTLLHHA